MENAENSSPIPLRNSAVFLKGCEYLDTACLGVTNINHFVEFRADTRGLKNQHFVGSSSLFSGVPLPVKT